MIDKVFFQILNMSFASSFAIIFVLFARLILQLLALSQSAHNLKSFVKVEKRRLL